MSQAGDSLVDELNARYPVGTPCVYHAVRGCDGALQGPGQPVRIRSVFWRLGHGEVVVLVSGVSGCVAASHIVFEGGEVDEEPSQDRSGRGAEAGPRDGLPAAKDEPATPPYPVPAEPGPSLTARGTLADAWAEFESLVLPGDASAVQRREMRRAYYGGAWVVLCLLDTISDPSVSEASGLRLVEGVREEIVRFKAEVLSGRA